VLGLWAALMLGLTLAASQAPATSYTWEGDAGTVWSNADSWTGGDGTTVPGAGDDAVFDLTGVYNAATVYIDGSREVATVTLSTTGGNYDITGGALEVLTVNASITQTANSATISAGVGTVGTGLTINVGGDLTISGAITGTGGITKTGAGTLTLGGARIPTARRSAPGR
jgi:hypothetical protein